MSPDASHQPQLPTPATDPSPRPQPQPQPQSPTPPPATSPSHHLLHTSGIRGESAAYSRKSDTAGLIAAARCTSRGRIGTLISLRRMSPGDRLPLSDGVGGCGRRRVRSHVERNRLLRGVGRLADDRLHGYRWESADGARVDLTPSREVVSSDVEGQPTLVWSGPGVTPMAFAAIFHLQGPGAMIEHPGPAPLPVPIDPARPPESFEPPGIEPPPSACR